MKDEAQPAAQPPAPVHSMIILHSGEGAGERTRLMERLTAMFQVDASTRVRVWSFHQLERLDFRAMAGRLARDASVLALAATEPAAPPPHVRRWIEHAWNGEFHPKPVLISLEAGSPACSAYLHSLSTRWRTPCLTAPDWGSNRQQPSTAPAQETPSRSACAGARASAGPQPAWLRPALPRRKPRLPPVRVPVHSF